MINIADEFLYSKSLFIELELNLVIMPLKVAMNSGENPSFVALFVSTHFSTSLATKCLLPKIIIHKKNHENISFLIKFLDFDLNLYRR